MVNIGDLKNRITIQGRDSAGLWTDYVKVWAAIYPLSAKEPFDRGDVQQNATHRVVIRRRKDVKSTMRLLFAGRIYDIQSILPHYRDRDRQEMICEELHEMYDTVSVIRSESKVGAYNVVTSVPLPPREISCCIVDVQHNHNQAGTDPVTWQTKIQIDCYLGEDVIQGDTIRLSDLGDFFVTEARPAKHFLTVTATQAKRGAE